MRIAILGYTQSGKSTAGKILAEELDLKYANVSDEIKRAFRGVMGDDKYNDVMAALKGDDEALESIARVALYCFGRGAEWVEADMFVYGLIDAGCHIICGIRTKDELAACRHQNYFVHYVWVDRPGTEQGATDELTAAIAKETVEPLPTHPSRRYVTFAVVTNDGTIDDLRAKLLAAVGKEGKDG